VVINKDLFNYDRPMLCSYSPHNNYWAQFLVDDQSSSVSLSACACVRVQDYKSQSTYSGYDLCHLVNTHTDTQTALYQLYY